MSITVLVYAYEQLNSTETLQVAYNPASPSQSLVYPGLNFSLALVAFVSILTSLFQLAILRVIWMHLATWRFTDSASVYRVPTRGQYYVDLTVGTIYVCTLGFIMLAPQAPVSTPTFGALMLLIAVLGSYCWTARFDKAQADDITKQTKAGKTIAYGLEPI